MFHQTEGVGETFDVALLHHAQRVGWDILNAVAADIKTGSVQAEVKASPAQLRLGRNTVCGFNKTPVSDAPLAEDDIFFIDIGVLVDGYGRWRGSPKPLPLTSKGSPVAMSRTESTAEACSRVSFSDRSHHRVPTISIGWRRWSLPSLERAKRRSCSPDIRSHRRLSPSP